MGPGRPPRPGGGREVGTGGCGRLLRRRGPESGPSLACEEPPRRAATAGRRPSVEEREPGGRLRAAALTGLSAPLSPPGQRFPPPLPAHQRPGPPRPAPPPPSRRGNGGRCCAELDGGGEAAWSGGDTTLLPASVRGGRGCGRRPARRRRRRGRLSPGLMAGLGVEAPGGNREPGPGRGVVAAAEGGPG